jgi:hypothetical protein
VAQRCLGYVIAGSLSFAGFCLPLSVAEALQMHGTIHFPGDDQVMTRTFFLLSCSEKSL